MPRPSLPPTPGSSTSFKPKSLDISPDQALSFSLPPPALSPANQHSQPPSPVSPPVQSPTSRRNSSAREQRQAQKLPPPPTRSRKIIQMKPELQPAPSKGADAAASTAAIAASNAAGAAAVPAKRKQPTPTSAAGRKIARKTAHSLIERRRRSKMNEEFAVLKGMIPACAGIEMHKLAILQASIEYLRYLESCVAELKNSDERGTPSHVEFTSRMNTPNGHSMDVDQGDSEPGDEEEEEAEDAEADGSSRSSSGSAAQSSYNPSPAFGATISPSLYPVFNSSMNLSNLSTLSATGGSDTEAGHALMMLGTAAAGTVARDTDRRVLRVQDLLTP